LDRNFGALPWESVLDAVLESMDQFLADASIQTRAVGVLLMLLEEASDPGIPHLVASSNALQSACCAVPNLVGKVALTQKMATLILELCGPDCGDLRTPTLANLVTHDHDVSNGAVTVTECVDLISQSINQWEQCRSVAAIDRRALMTKLGVVLGSLESLSTDATALFTRGRSESLATATSDDEEIRSPTRKTHISRNSISLGGITYSISSDSGDSDDDEAPLGTSRLSLSSSEGSTAQPAGNVLACIYAYKAENLKDTAYFETEMYRLSPYLSFTVHGEQVKTDVHVDGCKEPNWKGQKCILTIPSFGRGQEPSVTVECWSQDSPGSPLNGRRRSLTDHRLGSVVLKLPLPTAPGKSPPPSKWRTLFDARGKVVGRLQLGIVVNEVPEPLSDDDADSENGLANGVGTASVCVQAFKGRNLKDVAYLEKQSPFLTYSIHRAQGETKVAKGGGTKPNWMGEECQLSIPGSFEGPDLPTIRVECWDHEASGKHRFIGCADVEVPAPPPDGETEADGGQHQVPRWYAIHDETGTAEHGELKLRVVVSGSLQLCATERPVHGGRTSTRNGPKAPDTPTRRRTLEALARGEGEGDEVTPEVAVDTPTRRRTLEALARGMGEDDVPTPRRGRGRTASSLDGWEDDRSNSNYTSPRATLEALARGEGEEAILVGLRKGRGSTTSSVDVSADVSADMSADDYGSDRHQQTAARMDGSGSDAGDFDESSDDRGLNKPRGKDGGRHDDGLETARQLCLNAMDQYAPSFLPPFLYVLFSFLHLPSFLCHPFLPPSLLRLLLPSFIAYLK
jgi:hypothetical protein